MQMTWRLPKNVAAQLGLHPTPADIYTLSSAEFAGRLTRATRTVYNEELKETEKHYHVMRLATAAARAIMQRPNAAQIVMDCGGFQVFEIIELIDEAAGLEWLKALFAVYVDHRFQDPGSKGTSDYAAWARVLGDDEIAAIAAMEVPQESEFEEDNKRGITWMLMDRAAQLYLALKQPLQLPDLAPLTAIEEEIPMSVPKPELVSATPGQQFTLPLEADLSLVGTQAEGDIYGSQKDV
ncbi:MAG: hypothetical protein DWQ07_17625 [Chloroflexi bacterium]|nr:MAG: hypothetical protein DWQ07_17625 [Chloroflexota bacterium]